MLCQMKVTQERHCSTSERPVVTVSSLGKEAGCDLDVASKRFASGIKSGIRTTSKESKSPPQNTWEKNFMSTREAFGKVNHGHSLRGYIFKARLSFHYIVAMQVNK